MQMNRLKDPDAKGKKRKKKIIHKKSIMQDVEDKRCYLCMLLNDDFSYKVTECHHCIHGTGLKPVGERLGLKVNLCNIHHRNHKEAVHENETNDLILKRAAQRKYEETHSRKEWMEEVGRNWL